MKKVKIRSLGIQLIALFFLIFLSLSPLPNTLHPAFAADSTPSSDIKSKLADLEKEIASKAAKLKQQISGKLSNKAYIGKVKVISTNTITIATVNGPKLVNINQDTIFESKIKTKKYLRLGDWFARAGKLCPRHSAFST